MKKLFFALITSFLFVATAWGQCYKTEPNFTLNTIDDHTINFNGKSYKHIYFTAKKGKFLFDGAGKLKIKEYVDGQENIIFDQDITTSDRDYSCNINPRATAIQFYTVTGATLEKDVKNIKLEYEPTISISPLINFAGIERNITKSLEEDLSYYGVAGTLELGLGNVGVSSKGMFTLNKTKINADCKDTSEKLSISFKPTELGVYSENIVFSNSNITATIYGECSKNMEKTDILEVKRISYASVRLGWSQIEGATGYRIVNTTTGMSYFAEAEDTDYNVTGLKMGNTYKFVVHAMYNGATSLNHSNEVEVTTKVKPGVVLEECVAYSSSGKKSMVMGVNEEINYDIKSNNNIYNSSTYKVKFTAWKNWWGVTGYPDLYMLVKLDGKDYFESAKYWKAADAGITSDPQEFEALIPNNTVAIKFASGVANGTLDRYIENFTVYKDPILTSDVNTLDFGEVELGKSKTMKFNLTYMNAAKLEATEDSRFFEITKINYTASCTQGTQEVEITFTPTDCKTDYTASLSIFNGQELAITLKGRIKKSGAESDTIIWNGTASTEWDNRDNWIKEDGSQLLCTDRLSKNLTVILPAPNSTKYKVPEGGITQYPIIPDVSTQEKFFTERNKKWNGNQVNAGDNATAIEIAHKIYMEDGATLVGVETLNAGDISRYGEVEIDFTPVRCYTNDKGKLRYDWTLVGPVVKPWDEATSGLTRNVYSGDYYLNDLPHVYMRKAEVTKKDGKIEADWNSSFPDLDKGLTHDKAFAIKIPNEYGRDLILFGVETEKITAKQYNKYFCGGENVYDAKASHTYTFRGRFYNDASLPTYTLAESGKPYILNNSYPANIDAEKLSEGLNRPIQIYDYKSKAFVTLDDAEDKTIISQSSFIVSAKENNETIEIKKDWFETSKTGRRSASVDTESFRIELRNDANSSASEIYVCYDELKEDEKNYSFDAPKIFNKMEASLPDLYTIRYNEKWSGLVIPTISEPIPLGINVSSVNQSVTFSLKKTTMSSDVILEDRSTKTQYNLSAGETYQVDDLRIGLNEGRFYLLLSEQEEDPEVSTDVEDVTIGNIDIYSQGNSVVVSSTSDIELMQVIVSDMAGRSQVYNVSENYAQLNLPIETGVYTISVVGDKATRVEKIKLN